MRREPIRIANKHSGSLIVDADVQPGGRIEIVDDCLPVGQTVHVSVNYRVEAPRLELDDIIERARHNPNPLFTSAEEVDAYIREIRGK